MRRCVAHAVSRIDLLVLSHGHADHVAGLEDVIGRWPSSTALLPQPPEPSEALDELAARLEAAGTEVRRVTTAQDVAGQGWALRVLPTSAPGGEGGNQGENDCALVVLVELRRPSRAGARRRRGGGARPTSTCPRARWSSCRTTAAGEA